MGTSIAFRETDTAALPAPESRQTHVPQSTGTTTRPQPDTTRTFPVALHISTTLVARARTCTRLLATLMLAACAAGDADGAPFNADGTTADLEAIAQAYRTPAVQSFAASRGLIDHALGTQTVTSATELAAARTRAQFGGGARLFALHAHAAATRGDEPRPSGVAILPAHVHGTTFLWEPGRSRYVAGRESGAPAHGARFVLYAVDPGTGRPAEPLRPVGHVDVTDSVTPAESAVRLQVVSASTTWLDYAVTAERSSEGAVVAIRGFATNGADRVTFDVQTALALDEGDDAGRIDYRLAVPTRDLALQWTVALGGLHTAGAPVSLDLALGSTGGSVLLGGTVTNGAGTLHVLANNVPVSTVSLSRTGVTLARPDGTELDSAEARALRRVLSSVEDASRFSDLLLAPVASVM